MPKDAVERRERGSWPKVHEVEDNPSSVNAIDCPGLSPRPASTKATTATISAAKVPKLDATLDH